jgi:hypothetical protein
MKKISIIVIIIASLGIIGSEIIVLYNNSLLGHDAVSVSFILLGIGVILLGVNQLKFKENKE